MLTFYFYIIFKLKFHEKTFIFTPLTAVINGGNTVLMEDNDTDTDINGLAFFAWEVGKQI